MYAGKRIGVCTLIHPHVFALESQKNQAAACWPIKVKRITTSFRRKPESSMDACEALNMGFVCCAQRI
jgi:hypothetical protein